MSEERKFRPTTVGELIYALRKFPYTYRIMVRGYESGFDDPEALSIVHVKVDPCDSSVYGNYESALMDELGAFSAVLIDRP